MMGLRCALGETEWANKKSKNNRNSVSEVLLSTSNDESRPNGELMNVLAAISPGSSERLLTRKRKKNISEKKKPSSNGYYDREG